MNRVAERGLDLRRRNRIRLRRAVEQHAHALAARAELSDAIEQALRVAHRRHVGIGDEADRVGRVERRHEQALIWLPASITMYSYCLRQQPEDLFEPAASAGPGRSK